MKEYLKLIGFFSSFSESDLEEFSDIAEVISVKKDEFILKETNDGKGIYFIVDGNFDVLKLIEEKKYKRLQKLDRGDFFGEMSILNDEKNSASIISCGTGTLIYISKEAFSNLYENNSKISFKIMKSLATILSERLRHMNLKYGMSVAQLEKEIN